MATDIDVIIAGGGPVGLAAAIEARTAGLTVLVCEPRPGPVDKACGEGLMPGAVQQLRRLGVEPVGVPLAGIRYLDGQAAVSHRFRSGPGRGVRRTVLHAALAARADELGVAVTPLRVSRIEQHYPEVTVNGQLRARWLFACDGLRSPVRRMLGLENQPAAGVGARRLRGGWLAPTGSGAARYGLRQHFRVPPWTDFVEVHWTPSAEVYVTPVRDDEGSAAVLGRRGQDYDDVLASTPGVGERLFEAPRVSTLRGAGPLQQRAIRRVAGRVLLVGDASGYVDALTGEGIRMGLAQAHAAVAAIAAEEPDRYEHAWRGITRNYRMLTSAMVAAACRPALRTRIVPLATRLPRVYGSIVERLAR